MYAGWEQPLKRKQLMCSLQVSPRKEHRKPGSSNSQRLAGLQVRKLSVLSSVSGVWVQSVDQNWSFPPASEQVGVLPTLPGLSGRRVEPPGAPRDPPDAQGAFPGVLPCSRLPAPWRACVHRGSQKPPRPQEHGRSDRRNAADTVHVSYPKSSSGGRLVLLGPAGQLGTRHRATVPWAPVSKP